LSARLRYSIRRIVGDANFHFVIYAESITNDFLPGIPMSGGKMRTGRHQLEAESPLLPQLRQ
jgi:hypothetical protein